MRTGVDGHSRCHLSDNTVVDLAIGLQLQEVVKVVNNALAAGAHLGRQQQ